MKAATTTKQARNSRFQKGTGMFTCRSCGKKTRATGRGDNENVQVCATCYDIAGIENTISDNGSTPELEAELAALKAQRDGKKATITKPAAKKAKPAAKKPAATKAKAASKTTAAKSNTYATAEAAVKAALADGRDRTAVIQVGPAAFTLGSRRAALKHGYTVLGRAAALAAK